MTKNYAEEEFSSSRSFDQLVTSTCIRADRFMNSTSVFSSISSKSSMFKKHALRYINKVSNELTSFVFITSKLLDAFHHVFKMRNFFKI